MGGGQSKSLSDTVLECRLAKKRLASAAAKCEKEVKKEEKKVETEIRRNNAEFARIYANSAITKKGDALK